MSDGDSTVVDGRREPGDIGHHSPTHTHDDVCSCEAELRKAAAELLDGAHGLSFFAIVNDERVLLRAGVDVHAHARLGDDRGSRGAARDHAAQPVPGTRSHEHGVRPFSQVYRQLSHSNSNGNADRRQTGASTSSSSRATCREERPSTSTTRSATSW